MREWTVLVETMAPDKDELVEPEAFGAGRGGDRARPSPTSWRPS